MMLNPERLIKRAQLPLSQAPRQLFSQAPAGEPAQGVESDPERYDDSEFYQQLLKQFLEANSSAASLGATLASRGKKSRNTRDRRASKGRRLRYDVQVADSAAMQAQGCPQRSLTYKRTVVRLRQVPTTAVVLVRRRSWSTSWWHASTRSRRWPTSCSGTCSAKAQYRKLLQLREFKCACLRSSTSASNLEQNNMCTV